MDKLYYIKSCCLPIRLDNIDTDQIIPARFLKTTKREGIGKHLFYNWRYDLEGNPKKGSIFWDNKFKNAKIMLVGDNFGTGSSREHAVWSILDYGFKVVISSSFGEIFYNNSLKNGLLPIAISPNTLVEIFSLVEKKPETQIAIDLSQQHIVLPNSIVHFKIDPFQKSQLIKGLDELGYILSLEDKIKEYEMSHASLLFNL